MHHNLYQRFLRGRDLARRRFVSFVELLLSNALANALLFGGVYILSQIISPAEFGKYSVFAALALALYPIFTLRYEFAIPAAATDRVARTLFFVCVIFCSGITALSLILSSMIYITGFPEFLLEGNWAYYVYLLPPTCFALSIFSISQSTMLRSGLLRNLAFSRVLRAIALVLFQIFLAVAIYANAQSLILGEIIANLIISAILFRQAYRHYNDKLQHISIKSNKLYKDMIASIRYYKAFAIISLPHAFTHQALVAVYGIILGFLYGANSVGQYYLMRKLIFGVTALLSTATYQIGVSESSKEKGNTEKLRGIYMYVAGIIGLVTIPSAIAMVLFGGPIFTKIFGAEWAPAGQLAAAAFLLIAVEPIASAIAFIPVFLKRQTEAFIWSIGQNVVGIVSLTVIYAAGGDITAAILGSSLAVGAVLIAYLIRLYSLCRVQDAPISENKA